MNRRDFELLDKELWGVSPTPPHSADIIALALVIVFLAGIGIGAVLFAHDSKPTQTVSRDALAAISLFNGVPPSQE